MSDGYFLSMPERRRADEMWAEGFNTFDIAQELQCPEYAVWNYRGFKERVFDLLSRQERAKGK